MKLLILYHIENIENSPIILSALLLKLGTYSLLQVIHSLYYNSVEINLLIVIFRFISTLYIRIICLYQIDIKILVAYSSVVHIGLLSRSIITILKVYNNDCSWNMLKWIILFSKFILY